MIRRIEDIIAGKVETALVNNGILGPERDRYELEIVSAYYYMNPQEKNPDERLYAALIVLAYPLPLRENDRVEHWGDIREPYGPQEMYDQIVGVMLGKIAAEVQKAQELLPGEGAGALSPGGLIVGRPT